MLFGFRHRSFIDCHARYSFFTSPKREKPCVEFPCAVTSFDRHPQLLLCPLHKLPPSTIPLFPHSQTQSHILIFAPLGTSLIPANPVTRQRVNILPVRLTKRLPVGIGATTISDDSFMVVHVLGLEAASPSKALRLRHCNYWTQKRQQF